ncbi:MAG TPA: type II 3-dehydroquinate dehydratase [Bacteroidia bacterium]|nr:type II 3-dehydroquinate dehydratase [Bacteroidia bacterium]
MKVMIINGANLNLLGTRETSIYGNERFETYLSRLKAGYPDVTIGYFQSNIEGELVDSIQQNGFNCDGLIINAGGYTHTSVAIADAVAAVSAPVIEVHISNIFARESFRKESFLSSKSKGIISGLGLDVYELALLHLCKLLKAGS